jgi:hypothetical protein
MEFYSRSQPNMVSSKTIKNLEKLLGGENQVDTPEMSFAKLFNNFYNDYLVPNGFVLSLLFLFCLFLLYRYMFKGSELFMPTFNPSIETKQQQSYVNYLPDNIPVIMGDKVVNYNDVHKKPKLKYKYPPMITNSEDRDLYVGIENTYRDAEDQIFEQPLGFPKNFNTSTAESVDYMTDKNRQTLNEMSQIIFNEEKALIGAHNQTPVFKRSYDDYSLIPPFAE